MPTPPLEIFVDILADNHSSALISDAQMVVYAVKKIREFRESHPDYQSLESPDRSVTIFGNYIVFYRQFSPDEIIITLQDPELMAIESLEEKDDSIIGEIVGYIHENYEALKMQVALVKDI